MIVIYDGNVKLFNLDGGIFFLIFDWLRTVPDTSN